jgi:phage terminase large subunit
VVVKRRADPDVVEVATPTTAPRGRAQILAALKESRERLRTYKPRFVVRIVVDGRERILYRAQPKQDTLHAAAAPNILYGGAAGGAKSHGMRWDGIIKCLRVKGLKVLFLRRTYPELKRTHLLKIQTELPRELATYHKSDYRLDFPATGSLMQFGHCQDMRALAGYLSTEWDVIYIDEASTFLPIMLSMLQTRARSTLPGVVPQFILGSNPGGDAHLWLLQRFIDKSVPSEEDPDGEYDPDEYLFIRSLLTDNAYIQDAYITRLLALPLQEQEAYLYGKWTAFSGQFFREWSPDHHARRLARVPDWWELAGGMDWGYSPDPGCAHLAAFDEFGRAHVIRETVFRELAPRGVAEQLADAFPEGRTREIVLQGDTQMWAKQVHSGVSIAEDINDRLAELGSKITLVPANKDRINGWMRVRSFLAFRADPLPPRTAERPPPVPWMVVATPDVATGYGCPTLIASLPAQAFDDRPTHTGDMKPSATDHAPDSLRYLIMAREPLSEVPVEERPGKAHHARVHEHARKQLERAAAARAVENPELAAMPVVLPIDAGEAQGHDVELDAGGPGLDAFYHG